MVGVVNKNGRGFKFSRALCAQISKHPPPFVKYWIRHCMLLDQFSLGFYACIIYYTNIGYPLFLGEHAL